MATVSRLVATRDNPKRYTAKGTGTDVDQPRNLAKSVTVE